MVPSTPTPAAAKANPDVPALPVPEKFRDPETGAVRVEALLKSYLDLERKLARMVPAPQPDMPEPDRKRLAAALGVPGDPSGYRVACPHGLFGPDAEINGKLHQAAFTEDQAQLVYDLAAERLIPMVRELAAEFQAEREIERLIDYFGGEARWREVSRQMRAWARRQLPAEAVDGLSTSFDGVLALYKMMANGETRPIHPGEGDADDTADEHALHTLMRDPKYWRDGDPATLAKVTAGFRRLYGGAQ